MTPQELYDKLNEAGLEFDVVQAFEGARWLIFLVDEEEDENE